MKDEDLPIDRSKHVLYTKKAKRCVQRLLRRSYDAATAAALWEKIQMQYTEFLRDEPALGGVKMTVSIYDPILIFAWYVTVPEKPPIDDVQQEIFNCFMSAFDTLGKVFDLNRKADMLLANCAFRRTSDLREKEIRAFPASFRMGFYDFDRENSVVRYSFTQCPNAEFAKRHHLEDVLPLMCNCDHMAMRAIHAALIREGTCCTSERCDYCIVGDRNPLAAEYELVKKENGLLVSVKTTLR